MKVACSRCNAGPLACWISAFGVEFCEPCGRGALEEARRDDLARSGWQALSRLLVWVGTERMAQAVATTLAGAVGDMTAEDAIAGARLLAFGGAVRVGGLRVEFPTEPVL